MKPWYTSKTIIFNLAASVIAFLAVSIEPLRPLMTPTVFTLFSLGVGIANVALRFITTQAIGKTE